MVNNLDALMLDAWTKEDVEIYSGSGDRERRLVHPILLSYLKDVCDKRVVDYGCGEGYFVKELLELGAEVYGFDISSSMIDKSKKIISSANLQVIESGKIPLNNNSVDAVVSNLVLMMCSSVDELNKVFSDSYRILKKGGKFAFCLPHPCFTDQEFTTYENIFDPVRDYFKNGQSYQFVINSEDGKRVTSPNFIDYHYSLGTYMKLLICSGFNLDLFHEAKVEGNKLPPYLVIGGKK